LLYLLFLAQASLTHQVETATQDDVPDTCRVTKPYQTSTPWHQPSCIVNQNTPNKTTTVQEALKQIAAGKGDPTPLAVTFDDLHGLWGGLRLTIHGTGRVDQKADREQVGEPRKVYRKELDLLAALLVRQAAWEQRTPERTARPDESRAYLTIEYGAVSAVIWEWYNELEQNRRIGEIRDFMKKIAWNHSGSSVAGPTSPPEIHAVTAHGITAHFDGEKTPVAVDAPLEYGKNRVYTSNSSAGVNPFLDLPRLSPRPGAQRIGARSRAAMLLPRQIFGEKSP
jgi:hypothetical protein